MLKLYITATEAERIILSSDCDVMDPIYVTIMSKSLSCNFIFVKLVIVVLDITKALSTTEANCKFNLTKLHRYSDRLFYERSVGHPPENKRASCTVFVGLLIVKMSLCHS